MATKENIQKLASAKLFGQHTADLIIRLVNGESADAIIAAERAPRPRVQAPAAAGSASSSSSASAPVAAAVPRPPRTHTGEPSKTTLFVANLPFSVTDTELLQTFNEFHPKEARVAVRRDRRSRGYGFVTFDSEKSMDDALKGLDKHLIGDREISVRVVLGEGQRTERPPRVDMPRIPRVDQPRMSRPRVSAAPIGEPSKTIAFIGNLAYSIDDAKLATLLQPFKCQPPKVSRRPDGSSLGFAHVTFESEAEQTKAITSLNGSQFEGRALNVQQATKSSRPPRMAGSSPAAFGGAPRAPRVPHPTRIPTGGDASKTTLFVANLPYIVDDNGLLQIFEGFQVKEAHVPRRRNGYSTGYGFVTLATEEEAQRALKEVDKSLVEKREISVRAAFNRPPPASEVAAPKAQ